MDRETFEAELMRDGFEIKEGGMAAGTVVPDHTHPFDARVFVLSGEITIARDGQAQTYGAGDWCAVDRDTVHAEAVGPEDVVYVAGRRES
ncbi:MAG: cupin domain-containing protein [Alphaproteobacteria bacterium]|jgi:quercetin dioxygenase-like cupin family protein|nr:cupin domain-containing protein [Alphaproteobacteria bacterium]